MKGKPDDHSGGEDYLSNSGTGSKKKRNPLIVVAVRCKNCQTVYSRPLPEYCLKCGRRGFEKLKQVPREPPNQMRLPFREGQES